jgi:hypothetical protein
MILYIAMGWIIGTFFDVRLVVGSVLLCLVVYVSRHRQDEKKWKYWLKRMSQA